MDKKQVSNEECMYQSMFNFVQLCRIKVSESESNVLIYFCVFCNKNLLSLCLKYTQLNPSIQIAFYPCVHLCEQYPQATQS